MNTMDPRTLRRLNLGCGTDTREGWVNLDIAELPGVDIVHDVTKLPLPFEDDSFDEILCNDILEHVEYAPILKDLHRILTPGGKLHIRVPHFTSWANFVDPTHRRLFSILTFDFFVRGSDVHAERSYYFDFSFEKIEKKEITFDLHSRSLIYNKFVKKYINGSSKRQAWYEMTGFSRLFPAQNITITLIK